MEGNLSPLKARRMTRGLTLRQAAKHIRYSHVALWAWERGDAPLPNDVKPALAKLYRCSVKNLEKWTLDAVRSPDRMGA